MRHINDKGLDIIKEREGLKLTKYMDDNDGWTVGYGHLIKGDEPFCCDNIDDCKAEELLKCDLYDTQSKLAMATQKIPLNDNQWSALVSFVYNIGIGQFLNSTMFKKLKALDYDGAARQFDKWVYDDGKKMPGLVIRRKKEKELFNEVP